MQIKIQILKGRKFTNCRKIFCETVVVQKPLHDQRTHKETISTSDDCVR